MHRGDLSDDERRAAPHSPPSRRAYARVSVSLRRHALKIDRDRWRALFL
jgi:hypothetical protein